MKRKLGVLMGFLMLAGVAMADSADGRNDPGGQLLQFTDRVAGGKVLWQINLGTGASCQKFLSLFDSQSSFVQSALDCWSAADAAAFSYQAALKPKAAGTDLLLEAESLEGCTAALAVIDEVKAYTPAGECVKK